MSTNRYYHIALLLIALLFTSSAVYGQKLSEACSDLNESDLSQTLKVGESYFYDNKFLPEEKVTITGSFQTRADKGSLAFLDASGAVIGKPTNMPGDAIYRTEAKGPFVIGWQNATNSTSVITLKFKCESDLNPPQAVDDEYSVPSGKSSDFDVLANDVDPAGGGLSIITWDGPEHGKLEPIKERKAFRYTPDTGHTGEDKFCYIVRDIAGLDSNCAWVNITVVNNSPPTANDDEASTTEGKGVLIDVLENDKDPDGDTLTIEFATDPSNGSTSVEDGKVRYNPNEGFVGSDTFSYEISDGNGGLAAADVKVEVASSNRPPKAEADTATTSVDESVEIDVLSNDSDPDGDTILIASIGDPANGSAELTKTGKIEYTPNSGFEGDDKFNYTIGDGNDATAQASVSIKVVRTNKAPDANDDSATTTKGQSVTIDVLENDSDPDGDDLTIEITGNPDNGEVAIENLEIAYEPDPDFVGTDTFTYKVLDGNGGEDEAKVTVTVEKGNTAPNAVDDSAETSKDQAVTIDVLGNDTDADEDEIKITKVGDPSNGTSKITDDGKVEYKPNTGFTGDDSFSYTIGDENGAEDEATVKIKVVTGNAAPKAVDDSADTEAGEAVTIDVLGNDSDPDGDSIKITEVGNPENGSTRITDDGKVEYTPNDGFAGKDAFDYTITDDNGATSEATVNVDVAEPKLVVNAEDLEAEIDTSTPLIIQVLTNNELSSEGWSISILNQPDNGTAEVREDSVRYVPNDGFVGTDSFGYRKTAPSGESDDGTITVTVTSSTPLEEETVPTTVTLDQNYPNPFNPSTQISFAIPEATDARILIFDALGKQVRELSLGKIAAGRHQVTWDSRNAAGGEVPSGVYVYQLSAGAERLVRTMILLR